MVLRLTLFNTKGDRVFGTDQPITVLKNKDELDSLAAAAYEHAVQFPAPEPGIYRLELVLEDSMTTRVGYVSQELAVPATPPATP